MRKTPSQERSRLMVERIVAAGREVLVRDGYARFSTNRVADAAGISPGSFYQYFPDKHALVGVIVDRYWSEASDRVAASVTDHLGDDPAVLVRNVIDGLIAALEVDAELLRVTVEEVPLATLHDRQLALRRRIQELGIAWLTLSGRVPADRAAAVAWVIVNAMEALVVRWVIDRPDLSRETLVEELTRLAEAYA